MPRKRKDIAFDSEQDHISHKMSMGTIARDATFDPKTYEFDGRFKPAANSSFHSAHTVQEAFACAAANKDVEIGGMFMEADTRGQYRYRHIEGKKKLLEVWKENRRLKKFREADLFATDGWGGNAGANSGLIGDDYVPLLGGPFNKQPYLYDYLRAHAYCFQEYNHHPFARAIAHITRDFVLGNGYRVDSDDLEALAVWRAFEKVNNLEHRMEQAVLEGCIFGENMIWKLPNNEVNIAYQVAPGQEPKRGLLPRIRFIDPSTCWEIVTFPEDIERVLYYQLVFPTQYQIYTGSEGGKPVPTSKFIMQQIAAQDVLHFKFNCVSNEKRGRSDFYPVLGYLKWVKDCTNYKLIALKKQAAWTEDIIVEGSQVDVDNLTQSIAALGEFEPAGSRFIHTDKITRQYMANQGGSSSDDATLEWGLNMIAAGVQIPVSYFGLAHSAGQTRASAIVGTEPVAKKFERRQREVKRMLQALWDMVQDGYGRKGAECEITFPEIITQDRSQKLKDIKFTEDCGYIARASAAPLAAKEIQLEDYDYDTEKDKIALEKGEHVDPTIGSPLTSPAAAPAPGAQDATAPQTTSPKTGGNGITKSSSAVTKTQKHSLNMQDKTNGSA